VLLLKDVVRGIRHKGSAATGGSSQGESHYIIIGGTPQGTVIGAYIIGTGAITGGSL